MSGCVCLWLSNRVQYSAKENRVCPAVMAGAIVTLIVSMFVCVCVWLAVPSEEQATSEKPKNCHRLTELVLPLHTLCACLRMCMCVYPYVRRGRRWGCQTWTHDCNAWVCVGVRKSVEYREREKTRTCYSRYGTCVCVCLAKWEKPCVCAAFVPTW